MGSEVTWKHLLGLVAILAAVAFVHYGGEATTAQPLHHDHTKTWRYEKVPHRAPTALERRLGDAASFVARRPVEVRCEDFSDGTLVEPGGVVEFHGSQPADYTRIRPDVCSALARFTRSPAGASFCLARHYCSRAIVQSADALTVLAHESTHLRGIRTESVVQCYAMQEVPRLAKELGATDVDGRALAVIEYAVGYPRMPASYRSADCRPDGGLDLHPGGGWPD
jgi:hypothetical protein